MRIHDRLRRASGCGQPVAIRKRNDSMAPTRIKICGITREEDAMAAVAAGVDALGVVFYPPSPRYVDAEAAAAIVARVPPFVGIVGLFVDATPAEVAAVVRAVPLDMLQFQGAEAPVYGAAFERPWIKALPMKPGADIAAACNEYAGARAILLDTWCEIAPGGTGKRFDWQRVPARAARPLILAGGLDEHNVGHAIHLCRPAAVDVSGGVEAAPGIKDADRIVRFVAAVRAADAAREQVTV